MEADFDKEIDVLLRQAARAGDSSSFAADAHLDADEINAFAEHLLSGKAQTRAVEHLANCSRCRNILSSLIVFNHEPESEIVHAAPEKKTVVAVSVPWYKKIFVFPQIAYAMGILALVFGGIIAVIVLKTATQNSSSEVAQMEDAEAPSRAFPVSTSSNTTAASNASSTANLTSSATSANSNSSTVTPPKTENKTSSTSSNSTTTGKNSGAANSTSKPAPPTENETARKEKSEMLAAAPPAAALRTNDYDSASDSATAVPAKPAESPASQSENQPKKAADKKNVEELPINGRNTQSLSMMKNRAAVSGGVTDSASQKPEKAPETRSVGSRNFRRSGGVWYDANYKGQKTTNISRGSDEYKKLDAGVRSIADALGGTVVVISGGKAYRIQ